MEIFTAASHHDVLALVTQIAVLLFTARALGEVAQRLGQPSVVGEISAGILLGPSCLGALFPVIKGIIIPADLIQGYLLEAVSMIGAMFLLLITGLETDVKLIRRHARTALGVSAGGILVTFSSGFLLGQLIPDSLLVDPEKRLLFSLFIATAMSISAIPVIAKVLMDLQYMRRDIGQTIIAAGMCDDTTGWILLSIVAGLASGATVTAQHVLISVGSVLGFLLISFTLGKWFVKKALDFVQDESISQDRLLTSAVVLTFTWGSISQALHLEPVLGAFVMGVLLSQMARVPAAVHHQLKSMAFGIFSPIFFAVAGLKVNVLNLFTPRLMIIAGYVIAVAIAGKIVGTYLGARLVGRKNRWTALSFGAALNARGAMEIIIATIGLSLGILTQEMFSIIVLMAITTSLMAPSALRWVLKHVKPEAEELKRLEKEALSEKSPIANIHRVLLPVRYHMESHAAHAMQAIKLKILQRVAARKKLSITLLSVAEPGAKGKHAEFLNRLARAFPQQELVKKVVEHPNVVEAVLEEAQKDYDLLVLGASEQSSSAEHVFSTVIDSIMKLAPCTTLVVHAEKIEGAWAPGRMLVPTNGTLASQRAAEFAFLLAKPKEEVVTIVNVVERRPRSWFADLRGNTEETDLAIARNMVEELRKLGRSEEVQTVAHVQVGTDPETQVVELAEKEKMDLIVLGTDVRSVSDRLFLGPRVEGILKSASCPVVVLNSVFI